MRKISASLLSTLCMGTVALGAPTFCWAKQASFQDLEGQLREVRSHLLAAENIPGKAGLDQVKYFTLKQQELEAALKAQGADPRSFDSSNTPWSLRTLNEDPSTALGRSSLSKEDPELEGLTQALAAVERQIEELTQRFDDPQADQLALSGKLNTLLEKRYTLTLKKENLLEHPGRTLLAQNAQEVTESLRENLAKKDPVYIRHLQEALQLVYEKIYVLRAQTLASQDGSTIQKNGYAIEALEKQERTIKLNLKSLGIKPLPPKVLDHPSFDKIVLESDPVLFQRQLQTYDQELQSRMHEVQETIKNATSGAQIAQLGQQMGQLQTQRLLVKKMLKPFEKEAPITPQEPIALPHVKLTEPWGQATQAPRFFIADETATPLSVSPRIPPAARPQGISYKLWTNTSPAPSRSSQGSLSPTAPRATAREATLHAIRHI